DPQFRVAGDDVDVCWQLQKRGWTLGFSPAAVVWHHRRDSVRAYWRQQRGYGRAEALLEAKWPEKYNSAGHLTWTGRVYGRRRGRGVVRDQAAHAAGAPRPPGAHRRAPLPAAAGAPGRARGARAHAVAAAGGRGAGTALAAHLRRGAVRPLAGCDGEARLDG